MILAGPIRFNRAHRECIDTQYGHISLWTWLHLEARRILKHGRREKPQREAEIIVGDYATHPRGNPTGADLKRGIKSVWLWVDIPPGYRSS